MASRIACTPASGAGERRPVALLAFLWGGTSGMCASPGLRSGGVASALPASLKSSPHLPPPGWSRRYSAILQDKLLTAVKALVADRAPSRIVVGGYSRGGAMATLAAADLALRHAELGIKDPW